METTETIEKDWPFLLTLLPADLEASAKACGALVRKRGVTSAQALLRLAFAYGYCGLSLLGVTIWAREAGVADLSPPALLKRLQRAANWLGWLLAAQLAHRAALRREGWPGGLRLRVVDATTISRVGSPGSDYRIH